METKGQKTAGFDSSLLASAIVLSVLLVFFIYPGMQTQSQHGYADKRNFFGVPNTLNVLSNFPFLVVGAVGIVLCLHGNYFGFSSIGERLGWACFFVSIVANAFGSTYYHLRPSNARLLWDFLPMTAAYMAIMGVYILARSDEHTGSGFIYPLFLSALTTIACWWYADKLRLYPLMQLLPCVAIPAVVVALPHKYVNSSHWVYAAGCYSLGKVQEYADQKIFKSTLYTVSGHSLSHLTIAMVPIFIMMMLSRRHMKIERLTV